MKKKLLVIEDEKSVAKQLRWGLDKEYEITIAADAAYSRTPLSISSRAIIKNVGRSGKGCGVKYCKSTPEPFTTIVSVLAASKLLS